jgi:hypothetical protein
MISLLFVFVGGLSPARAELSSTPEYQVKAAFLYNFIKFVEWPGDGRAGAPSTLCLGILGKDPFGDALEVVRGKTAKGRTIVVVHFRRVEEVKDCDVLFISDSEKGQLAQTLKYLQNFPVLTVADLEGFCQAGGIIGLIEARKKVSFEVNIAAARRAGLRISSQLLKLARAVIE